MTRDWRGAGACAVVLALALTAFAMVTHGFAAVTSDGLRRAQLASTPRELPDLDLLDSSGASLSLREYARPADRITFVSLVYVRCSSICLASAGSQSWLQAEVQARGLEDRVRLLTLSFDPWNDTPAVLSDYALRLHADPRLWRIATVRSAGDVRRVLDLFGVVVLPDGRGGYSHNGALFAVGTGGRLERAYDPDRPDMALGSYLDRLGGS